MWNKKILFSQESYTEDRTGIITVENGISRYYKHLLIPKKYHGTGDIYSSVLVGTFLIGMKIYDAAWAAADFVVNCIEYSIKDPSHWYVIKLLINI